MAKRSRRGSRPDQAASKAKAKATPRPDEKATAKAKPQPARTAAKVKAAKPARRAKAKRTLGRALTAAEAALQAERDRLQRDW